MSKYTGGLGEIAIVLPFRADFSSQRAGAIELCVEETSRQSEFEPVIRVYGQPLVDPYEHISYHGVQLGYGLSRLKGRTVSMAQALVRLWKKTPPALVEVHNRANLFLMLKAALPDVPMTLHFHNDPQTIKCARLEGERAELLEKAERIICCSSWVAERFCDGLTDKEGKVCVVENGVPRPWGVRPVKEKLILFPNRLIEAKGSGIFARAVAKVLPEFPDWRCVFVGRGDEAVRADVIQATEGVRGQVDVLGPQPFALVLTLLERAGIVAVPVVWDEPFGRTAAEALAAGAALLATPHGGLADILKRAGVCVEANEASMAAGLRALLGDEDLLTQEQRRSWENFDFTIEASQRRLDDVRRQVLGMA